MSYKLLPFLFALSCAELSQPPQPSPEVPAKPISVQVAPKPPAVRRDATIPPHTCSVELCNKIERFSLDPISHLKDSIGESCFDAMLPEPVSRVGAVVDSQSRWWQGRGANPTKKSVTRVSQVYACGEVSP